MPNILSLKINLFPPYFLHPIKRCLIFQVAAGTLKLTCHKPYAQSYS